MFRDILPPARIAAKNTLVLAAKNLSDFLDGHEALAHQNIAQWNATPPGFQGGLYPQTLIEVLFFDEAPANGSLTEHELPFPLRLFTLQLLHARLRLDDASQSRVIDVPRLQENASNRPRISALLLIHGPLKGVLVDNPEIQGDCPEKMTVPRGRHVPQW